MDILSSCKKSCRFKLFYYYFLDPDYERLLFTERTLSWFRMSFSEEDSQLSQVLFTLRDHNAERKAHDPDLWAKREEKVAHFLANVCKKAFANVESRGFQKPEF